MTPHQKYIAFKTIVVREFLRFTNQKPLPEVTKEDVSSRASSGSRQSSPSESFFKSDLF